MWTSPGDVVLLPADERAPQGAVVELGGAGALPGADAGTTARSFPIRSGVLWERGAGRRGFKWRYKASKCAPSLFKGAENDLHDSGKTLC